MGKVTWGGDLSGSDLDNADRSQFRPYDGPTPANGLYAFRIKLLKRALSKNKNPQLVVGLELIPRQSRPEEKKYKGFFIMDYIPVMESTAFRVAPFLDAIGVSGEDFVKRTMAGEEEDRGTPIVRIGKWINDGKKLILATIADDQDQQGQARKRIASYWPVDEAPDSDDSDEDQDDEEEEEEQPAPRKPVKKAAPKKKAPEPDDEEDDDEEEEDDEEPPAPKKPKKAVKAAPKRRARREEPDADDDEEDEEEAPF